LGELNDEAFTEFGKRYKEHPDTHTVFKGYKLNFVPELIKTAKKLHLNAPQLGIISWDLTVDQNGVFALKNRRNILMWGLLIASVFIQRASLIYAIFPIFYFYYKKNKMTMKKATAFIIIGCAVGYIGKKVIIGGSIGYLTGGVYANYASASSSAGYLFDYIKLIVEQVIIDGYMILSYKKVNGQLQEMEELEKEKLRMLQMMCYFDLMLIPICYILGIWRGASYFFLPRLLILGYIITDFSRKISKNSRKAYYMIVKVAMPIWLVLRLFTVYDVSGLMPYYLDFRL